MSPAAGEIDDQGTATVAAMSAVENGADLAATARRTLAVIHRGIHSPRR